MDIRKLHNFCTVVKHGSLTKAAKHLYYSQPALSKQIRALEEEFDYLLFNRKGRNIKLNDNGKIVYQHSLKIVEQYNAMKKELDAFNKVQANRLIFGATNYIGIYMAPKILEHYKKINEKIQVSITIDFFNNIFKLFELNQIAFALMPESNDIYSRKDLYHRVFLEDELLAVASIDDPWATRNNIQLKELQDRHFLVSHPKSATRRYIESTLKNKGIILKRTQDLYSTESIKQGVLNGMGISILSKSSVIKEIEMGLLTQLDIKGYNLKRKLLLVHQKKRAFTKIENNFMEYIIHLSKKLEL